ncbi:uncharacterized protein LOC131688492 [Topomyia yanbarensis]|uniref:uncharacterized protein LOC131688492 n=1 Tax=Topomyia yanbarensis TaxID=2498891 RepID=UPI00273A79CD|nr:uncharacterized protein LOC131688492 [Topomyia yanbarensis]XP_058828766.1 uncharacterized protein LOC131688492 [Topomyia yanbarensis]
MIGTNTDLSRNIAGLCRICSAPGSHSLFAKIPPYLHEHPRECPRWTMPIGKLVTEVAGIDISKDDGLPQKICVLCISYLKHAYTFRRQTIDNVAALLAARYLVGLQEQRNNDKNGAAVQREDTIPTVVVSAGVIRAEVNDVTYRMMNVGIGRPIAYQKSLDKEVMQRVLGCSVNMKKQNNVEEEQRQIEEAIRGRFQGTPPCAAKSGFFTYTEKEFEEDDVMELDVLKENNITFSLPADYKEKKCPSCRKRFMFDDSLNEHLEECLQFKLIKFIREVYHLLFLKENRSISSFEFIRRVVFSIRKSAQQISNVDGENVEDEEVEETPSVKIAEEPLKNDRSFIRNLEKLRTNYNPEGNNIPSPIFSQHMDDGRSSITTGSTSISPIVTVTRCEECQATFESVTDLEAHNLNYHRELPVPLATLNNQQTFFQLPISYVSLSSKDVPLIKNQLLSETPEPISGPSNADCEDRFKMIQCSTCSKRFYMISQLDEHRIRYHRKSPRPVKLPSAGNRGSPFDRNRKNLNASYFHTMEQLKDSN